MHPLDPLTAAEITATAKIVQSVNPKGSVHFKNISLLEPAKRELRRYLAAERSNDPVSALTRRASSLYYHRGTTDLFLAVINLTASSVEKIEKLEEGYHGQADMDEVLEVRAKCLSNPKVLERIRQYGLSDELEVVCDTWPYGRDTDDFTRRLAQVCPFSFMYFWKYGLIADCLGSATSTQNTSPTPAQTRMIIRSPSRPSSTMSQKSWLILLICHSVTITVSRQTWNIPITSHENGIMISTRNRNAPISSL